MKGRYYSPGWHRFLISNLGTDPSDMNGFAYCGRNPFMGVDPSGMDSEGAALLTYRDLSTGNPNGNPIYEPFFGPNAESKLIAFCQTKNLDYKKVGTVTMYDSDGQTLIKGAPWYIGIPMDTIDKGETFVSLAIQGMRDMSPEFAKYYEYVVKNGYTYWEKRLPDSLVGLTNRAEGVIYIDFNYGLYFYNGVVESIAHETRHGWQNIKMDWGGMRVWTYGPNGEMESHWLSPFNPIGLYRESRRSYQESYTEQDVGIFGMRISGSLVYGR